jgi:hypothetical protein
MLLGYPVVAHEHLCSNVGRVESHLFYRNICTYRTFSYMLLTWKGREFLLHSMMEIIRHVTLQIQWHKLRGRGVRKRDVVLKVPHRLEWVSRLCMSSF